MEQMQNSRESVADLRCGHAMHKKCFLKYLESKVACPICKKSVIDPKLFEEHFD